MKQFGKATLKFFIRRGIRGRNVVTAGFMANPEQFITILELPLVTDARSAEKVGVSYHIKQARND
ncbi:MAG: hypothetical protein ABIP71_06375 [Verrucomicrobiota bacterium]